MVNANIRTSKYLAAITVGFFVAVSPWTLCTLIIVAEKIKLQEDVDFIVTWLALSNSFWNCLIYGVMNRKFRRAALKFACGRWFKSLSDSVHIKTRGGSTELSEGSSTLANYTRRQNKKDLMGKYGDERLSVTVTGSMSESHTPNDSPRTSLNITETKY